MIPPEVTWLIRKWDKLDSAPDREFMPVDRHLGEGVTGSPSPPRLVLSAAVSVQVQPLGEREVTVMDRAIHSRA